MCSCVCVEEVKAAVDLVCFLSKKVIYLEREKTTKSGFVHLLLCLRKHSLSVDRANDYIRLHSCIFCIGLYVVA